MNNGWRKLEDMEETRQIRVNEPRSPEVEISKPAETPEPKQFPWYLLTGLILGFLLGLMYAWLINPVVYNDTEPASLREDFKQNYRLTIAQAYAITGDLERAESRLVLLNDEDPIFTLGSQAQQALAAGYTDNARALAVLAAALQGETDNLTPSNSP